MRAGDTRTQVEWEVGWSSGPRSDADALPWVCVGPWFINEFRCITMDQRNANGGESSGPIPVDDPWGAFAEDQLGLLDHLGIREFMVLGCCIGGPFVLKLMERAPDRVLAGVLCQPSGYRPENPDVMYNNNSN